MSGAESNGAPSLLSRWQCPFSENSSLTIFFFKLTQKIMQYLETAIGANIRAQCYKTFYDRNSRMFVISETVRMFVQGKPLKPSLRL